MPRKLPPLLRKRKTIATILFLGLVVWYYFSLPRLFEQTVYSTVLYGADGSLLGARVAEDGQWRFRPGETIAQKYLECLIAFEDKRFYRHGGVSVPALTRATVQNIRHRSVRSGGSTITMQLVRLGRHNPPRTFREKLREIILATRIEWSYTKEEILALYAAHAPFGGNVVGLEAAAWRYYGHSTEELSWAEAATLAVLPNSPGLIHPGRGRDDLLRKRNRLLTELEQAGKIDKTEYLLAMEEPLPEAPLPLPRLAPHLVDGLASGTRTISTIQPSIQQRVQSIVNHYGRGILAANHIRNAAVLVADIETGEVLAYVGNITDPSAHTSDGRSVDLIQARRSTGSLLKPILYGAMLSEGQILPETLVFDTPLNIAGFSPSNHNRSFSGVVTARSVIERSLNVPVVRMLSVYNTSLFLSLLQTLGMTTIDRDADHYGASLILGGAEGTLWDMCGMYASIARSLQTYNREGIYKKGDMRPLTFTGTNTRKNSAVSPLTPSAAWFMLEAMSGVNRPEEESAWQEFNSMKQVAWKTGTSYGNRDAWAIGLTPRHVVGVWVGNADGEGRAGMTGVGYAAPILFDVFSLLPSAGEWFEAPLSDMEYFDVCRRSGHRAGEWCRDSGDPVDTVALPKIGIESGICPYHRPVITDGGGTRGWFILPPAAEYYYRQVSSDYTPPPPVRGHSPLELIYPHHQAVLYLPRAIDQSPEKAGKFVFRAAHRADTATIHWHLDDRYLQSTRSQSVAGHTISVAPAPGEHLLTIVDGAGNRQAIRFRVLSSRENR